MNKPTLTKSIQSDGTVSWVIALKLNSGYLNIEAKDEGITVRAPRLGQKLDYQPDRHKGMPDSVVTMIHVWLED